MFAMKNAVSSGKTHKKQMALCALVALSAGVGLSEIRNPVLEPDEGETVRKGAFRAVSANWMQRAPDYAAEDGKDWAYYHGIEAKRCPYEPEQDPGVDLFYIYPTVVKTDSGTTVDGFVDIDDERMRGKDSNVWYDFEIQGRAFADIARVYVPYYRQMTMEKILDLTEEVDDAYTNANARVVDCLYNGVAYQDVTNALEHYFTRCNPGLRPFILAGHSQGSAMLVAVMAHYFTQDQAHLDYLNKMVACYAVGYGVTKDWVKMLEENTLGLVKFATNATDTGVYITWNTETEGGTGPTVLVPLGAVSVNPLTWTTDETPADEGLNHGALLDAETHTIVPGLYDARVDVKRGVVVCTTMPTNALSTGRLCFGKASFHNYDFPAYFQNIRENARVRVATMTGKVVGSESFPWTVGMETVAWTNGVGGLVIGGAGAVVSTPWVDCAGDVDELWAGKGVTDLSRVMATLPGLESVNGLSMDAFDSVVIGAVKVAGFSAIAVDPSGMVNLSVVVSKADSLSEPVVWTPVTTNDVSVRADAPSGFYIVAPQR